MLNWLETLAANPALVITDVRLAAAAVLAVLLAGWLAGALGHRLVARRRQASAFESGRQQAEIEARAAQQALGERLLLAERELAGGQQRERNADERVRRQAEVINQLSAERASAHTRISLGEEQQSEYRDQISVLDARNAELTTEVRRLSAELSALASARASEREALAERDALLARSEQKLTDQLEALASRLYEEKGRSINERARRNLENVLSPLREQMAEFRGRVEQVHVADTRERASLLTEVRNLQGASERINTEAANLARALKGDKKLQGTWGEMILERVLEESGLRRNHEFEVQPAMRDADGALKRPDVIVRLPDNKDVVIDAKVSLVAWEAAVAGADDAAAIDTALARFVTDLRTQVKRLAAQDYAALPRLRSLDFTLLFVPIEAAFAAALQRDERLFADSFSMRVVIVSPTTLSMTLRIIENLWRHERQSQNTREIARRAGSLYDKVRLLVEEVERLGTHLQRAGDSYAEVHNRLRAGRGNLVRQVDQLRDLGAEIKRPLETAVVNEARAETEVPRLEVVRGEGGARESTEDDA